MQTTGGGRKLIIAAGGGAIVILGAFFFSTVSPDIGGLLRTGPLDRDAARAELLELASEIAAPTSVPNFRESVPFGEQKSLEDTLPPVEDFPLTVDPVLGPQDSAVEIFSSTEKSGKGTDGWIVTLAEEFNKKDIRLNNGRTAKVKIRYIPSGTAHQFIARGSYRPDAFSPSSHLWIRMTEARGVTMTPIRERMVSNLAGIVMKTKFAAELKAATGTLEVKTLIDAVVQGRLAMGYTNPFASSAGLNFLVTVLQTFSNGDDQKLLSPDVASAFEAFQRGVPFVAFTTIQMRESVERDGSLDAFVMEYQTFFNDPVLKAGYEFIPFGPRHDNPLYAIGSPKPETLEILKAFAALADDPAMVESARKFGFDPPSEYQPSYDLPDGRLILKAQQLWKEKKNAGRPLAAVFLCDISGSMDGTRVAGVRDALKKASAFITPATTVGMATFADDVKIVLPIKPFDINQKATFLAASESMRVGGRTGMYNGIVVALSMLVEAQKSQPDLKPMLFVLTDGETNVGHEFNAVKAVLAGVGIPIHTIGYEANLPELQRLSTLVEATSLTADKEDVAYKLSMLFNAEM